MEDGTKVELTGFVFDQKIFPNGDEVFTRIDIRNEKMGHLMGQAYLDKKMSEKELSQTLETLPCESFLFAMYR